MASKELPSEIIKCRTFFCRSSTAALSSLISLREDIDVAPGVRRAAIGGLAATGGVGFGPRDVRLEGAGTPSVIEALGLFGTSGLVAPAEPAGDTTRVVVLTVSGAGDAGRLPASVAATGGFGGRDGLRVAVPGVPVPGAVGRVLIVGLAEAVDVLEVAGFAIVVAFVVGVAAALVAFFKVVAEGVLDVAVVALAALVMTEAVGLAAMIVWWKGFDM